jgi:lysophospholipase L1-like esterase
MRNYQLNRPFSLLWKILNLGVCIFLAALLDSCQKTDPTPPSPIVPVIPSAPSPVLRYLALGDSYTIGQNVPVEDRFPHQTVAKLKQSGRQFAEPEYIATTGWTTGNLLSAISAANKPKNYDVVSLLIGVNNQYQGRDTTEYRMQFTQCLQEAILHAGNRKERVFVLSIPDYGVTPFGKSMNPEKIAREIDAFNNINYQVSLIFGINYIEITKGSRDAINDISLVANDGLHPSGREYQKWAEKLSAQILTVLR